jgi:hypothetical protein
MLIFDLPLSFVLPLIVHAWAGLAAVICGIAAFRVSKRPGRHPRWGIRYLWAYTLVLLTATLLTIQIWSTHAYLLFIALTGYGFVLVAYAARRFRRAQRAPQCLQKHWLTIHLSGMIGSYVVLWIGFLVDNAPKVPGLVAVPVLVFWLLPPAVALPFLIRSLARVVPKHMAATRLSDQI